MKGIDHLCMAATLGWPKMWQSNLQPCCIAVSLESPRCDGFASASSPWIVTQDEHDIASWQVCSGGNIKLMCLSMMAFKQFNTAPLRYCMLNWCCAKLAQLICQMVMLKRDVILHLVTITNGLWLAILLCYDRCLGTLALFVATRASSLTLVVVVAVFAMANKLSSLPLRDTQHCCHNTCCCCCRYHSMQYKIIVQWCTRSRHQHLSLLLP